MCCEKFCILSREKCWSWHETEEWGNIKVFATLNNWWTRLACCFWFIQKKKEKTAMHGWFFNIANYAPRTSKTFRHRQSTALSFLSFGNIKKNLLLDKNSAFSMGKKQIVILDEGWWFYTHRQLFIACRHFRWFYIHKELRISCDLANFSKVYQTSKEQVRGNEDWRENHTPSLKDTIR